MYHLIIQNAVIEAVTNRGRLQLMRWNPTEKNTWQTRHRCGHTSVHPQAIPHPHTQLKSKLTMSDRILFFPPECNNAVGF